MRSFRDYGPRFGWFAYCQRCFHQSTLTPEDIARIGLDADVADVRRCLRCGARDALLYRHYRGDMDKDGPNPFAHLVPGVHSRFCAALVRRGGRGAERAAARQAP